MNPGKHLLATKDINNLFRHMGMKQNTSRDIRDAHSQKVNETSDKRMKQEPLIRLVNVSFCLSIKGSLVPKLKIHKKYNVHSFV